MLGLLLVLGLSIAHAEVPGLDVPATGLSARDKVQAVESAISEMHQSVATLEHLIEASKTDHAPEDEIQCLESTLVPIQALVQISIQSQNAMKQDIAGGDDSHGDLEYRKILVALAKVREFMAKAMLCAGNPAGAANTISQSNIITSPDDMADVQPPEDVESLTPINPASSF